MKQEGAEQVRGVEALAHFPGKKDLLMMAQHYSDCGSQEFNSSLYFMIVIGLLTSNIYLPLKYTLQWSYS